MNDSRRKNWLQVWFIFCFAAITQIMNGYYSACKLSPPNAMGPLSYLGLFWLIGDWFMMDSKKRNIPWVFDMGFFLYLSWPVFIPVYLVKTRGFGKAALYILGFLFVCMVSYMLGADVFIFFPRK